MYMQDCKRPDVFLCFNFMSSFCFFTCPVFCREKYMNTLLQVEVMLKIWFPQIQTQPVSAGSSFAASPARSPQETPPVTPPHKYWDQSHIPVKVRTHTFLDVQEPSCAHA